MPSSAWYPGFWMSFEVDTQRDNPVLEIYAGKVGENIFCVVGNLSLPSRSKLRQVQRMPKAALTKLLPCKRNSRLAKLTKQPSWTLYRSGAQHIVLFSQTYSPSFPSPHFIAVCDLILHYHCNATCQLSCVIHAPLKWVSHWDRCTTLMYHFSCLNLLELKALLC